MNFEITSHLSRGVYEKWRRLIEEAGLVPEERIERTLLVYDGDELIATGSREGCVLKLIAVTESHRGEDVTSRVLTELRKDAFSAGYSHLFLYTKPRNRYMFESLFFYPIVETDDVLFMENKKDGISEFCNSLPRFECSGEVGAIVMNCNPFTLGHRSLVECAASECDRVYLFVLSEDRSEFSFNDRFEMVLAGVRDLKNVVVVSTGPYLISSATFPSYFIKDRDLVGSVACSVDVKIFEEYFAPRLSITRRYVGTEPNSALTAEYNAILKKKLPKAGIEVREIERTCALGLPISASNVRKYVKSGDVDALSFLLPKTTLEYIIEKGYIKQ